MLILIEKLLGKTGGFSRESTTLPKYFQAHVLVFKAQRRTSSDSEVTFSYSRLIHPAELPFDIRVSSEKYRCFINTMLVFEKLRGLELSMIFNKMSDKHALSLTYTSSHSEPSVRTGSLLKLKKRDRFMPVHFTLFYDRIEYLSMTPNSSSKATSKLTAILRSECTANSLIAVSVWKKRRRSALRLRDFNRWSARNTSIVFSSLLERFGLSKPAQSLLSVNGKEEIVTGSSYTIIISLLLPPPPLPPPPG